jgi:proline iminopeptidase
MAHPQQVERLILWSVFLGRQAEVDYTNEGFPRYNFPEAWERFIALVPTQNRLNGNSIMQFYAEKVFLPDAAVAQRYAREWSLWEMSLISLNYDQRRIESEVAADEETLKRAKIQLHYALWKCFIPEDYILKNISKITHIPCAVVHGRFDMCCPPFIAADLAKAYGSNLSLQWVNSGHLRTEPEMLAALRATINARF